MLNIKEFVIAGFVALAGLSALPGNARAEMWRYTTEDGKTHYVDSKSKVPEQYHDRAILVKPIETGPPIIAPQAVPATKVDAMPGKRLGVDVDADGNNKEFWQAKLKAIKDREKAIDARLQEINNIGYLGDAPAARAIAGQIGKEKEDLEKEKAEIPKKIAELQEEARRKGAPPGWLR